MAYLGMKKKKNGHLQVPHKAPAGIQGLAEITRGGPPRGRATLIVRLSANAVKFGWNLPALPRSCKRFAS
jgi:hypothetical protein